MEHLEGKGSLNGEAMQYAIQIAGALDAAHRKGVIHRDLAGQRHADQGRGQAARFRAGQDC
jgi:hypothetical protein